MDPESYIVKKLPGSLGKSIPNIHSLSGIGTCIIIDKYGVVFDMGLQLDESLKYKKVFITHGN